MATRKTSAKTNKAPKEETYKVKGENLLAKVKEIINEGNVRKVIVKNKDGKTIVEVPLTIGVVGTVLIPTLVAIGALAAVLTECSITVVREKEDEEKKKD
jgi:hypothetical protein